MRRKNDPRANLRAVLGDYQLSSFPALAMKALELVRDPDVPLSEIADPVSADPGLSVSLLRTVNSAALALRHEVKNVEHAVQLLGRNKLESILIATAVREILPRPTEGAFDTGRFWATSARRAATAKELADRIDPSRSSESFTAALLQDMAVPVLHDHLGDRYAASIEEWNRGEDDLPAVERRAFGWDHAEVGSWMCAEWKFPELLTDAISNHHEDVSSDQAAMPAVNMVASFKEGDAAAGLDRLIEIARDTYGIPEAETQMLIDSSFEAAESTAKLFV